MLETFDGNQSEEFSDRLAAIGWRLGTTGTLNAFGKKDYPLYVATFVRVLVTPILDYLDFALSRDDLVHELMTRYKQRSEWFHSRRLIEIAQATNRAVEESLKRDFYGYLFDEGVEFTVAPESPGSLSEVDVLTARFPDNSRLLCEGKVFDGQHRRAADITSGIRQAAEYAYHWSEPRTYVLVYNIAAEIRLNFPGVQRLGELWAGESKGRSIFVASLDLNVSVPATEAGSIRTIDIEWPKT